MPKGVKASPKPETAEKQPVLVAERFLDKYDLKTWYEPKTDVSHFDADRLADLKQRGLVK